jgi:hypothetical protein
LHERYAAIGFKLREVELLPAGVIKFCSHSFTAPSWKPVLDSWPRCFYKLLTRSVLPDQLYQVLYEVRHHPRFDVLSSVAHACVTFRPGVGGPPPKDDTQK